MAAYNIETLKARFDSSPFTRWLDLDPVKISDEGLEFSIVTRPEMKGSPARNSLHGGVLAALIDIACSFALIVGDGNDHVTVDLRTDYHRASKGGRLRVKGGIVRRGRRLSTTEARIEDEEGVLIASGRGVFMTISAAGGKSDGKENSQ